MVLSAARHSSVSTTTQPGFYLVSRSSRSCDQLEEIAMLHFHDVSIKSKLYGLAILSMVGLAAVLGLAHYVITTYLVGGAVYERIALAKDLRGEQSPPTIFLGPSYIILREVRSVTTDPNELRRLIDRYHQREALYHKRHRDWVGTLPDNEVRR